MGPTLSSPRSPLLWFLAPLLTGYTLASFLPSLPFLYLPLALALAGWGTYHVLRHPVPGTFPKSLPWAVPLLTALLLTAVAYHHLRLPPEPPFARDAAPRALPLTIEVERLFQSADPRRANGLARIREAPEIVSHLEGQRIHFSLWLPGDMPATALTRSTRLRAQGLWQPVRPDPDDSFAQYLLRQGADSQWIRLHSAEIVRAPRSPYREARWAREWIRQTLLAGTAEPHRYSRVAVAMLLGERIQLEPEQYTAFLRTGTLHLFAISGLHIGIIAVSLLCFLRLLRLPRWPEIIIGLGTVLFYVEITGSPPSAVRAFLMVAFFWMARLFRQGGNPLASLANSAVVVLLWQPAQLWSAGFQLSYTVVATLLLLGVPLLELGRRWYRLPRDAPRGHSPWARRFLLAVLALFCVSLSATFGSAVLTVHYFGHFSPGAVGLNMILVPLAGLVLVSGMLSIGWAIVGLTPLSILCNHAAWTVIAVMEETVLRFLAVPGLFYAASYRSTLAVILGWLLLAGSLTLVHQRLLSRWGPVALALPFALLTLFFLVMLQLQPIPTGE